MILGTPPVTLSPTLGIVSAGDGMYDVRRIHDGPFDLRVIAHSLSQINRFTGHTPWPLSVAEHSVHVARRLPKRWRLRGLLHDAPEAVLGDLATPWKNHVPGMEVYRRLHDDCLRTVHRQFYLVDDADADAAVHDADVAQFHEEVRMYFPAHTFGYFQLPHAVATPLPAIVPLTAVQAKLEFLACVEEFARDAV